MGVLRFAGADAQSFLQGQVSNDTRRLAAGEPLRAAYSSPQGRVIAILELLPHASGILALLPRELAAPTRERLRRFVLRAKLQIEDLSDSLPVWGVHGAAALTAWELPRPAAKPAYMERGEVGIARVGGDPDRYWVVGDPGAAAGTVAAADVERDWRLANIRAGIPQVYAPTSEAFVAQMLNLDLVDGISFTKGCFTGQEIIARTQHLGRIKRRMFRLGLPPGAWRIGQTLRLADGRSGRLTELAESDAGIEALAVLNLAAAEPDGDDAEAAVTTAVELALPYEFARPAAISR
jgi:folate-binding protein YgfZ